MLILSYDIEIRMRSRTMIVNGTTSDVDITNIKWFNHASKYVKWGCAVSNTVSNKFEILIPKFWTLEAWTQLLCLMAWREKNAVSCNDN